MLIWYNNTDIDSGAISEPVRSMYELYETRD